MCGLHDDIACLNYVYMYLMLRYDLPNGFTYLQLGRDFINLFLFKYLPF